MSSPMAAPMALIRSGSQVAAQASGVGYTVAPQVKKPVRHSSWATAGMPNRFAATTRACSSASFLRPSSGPAGAVPNTRVSCPSPPAMAASNLSAPRKLSCIGATSPASSWSGHVLPSWRILSCGVIASNSALARTDAGRAMSFQGPLMVKASIRSVSLVLLWACGYGGRRTGRSLAARSHQPHDEVPPGEDVDDKDRHGGQHDRGEQRGDVGTVRRDEVEQAEG